VPANTAAPPMISAEVVISKLAIVITLPRSEGDIQIDHQNHLAF
jgi:hypothetical protein